jgi:tRNA threonylcarbamoyladenosine biosynthesis protein TsaB
MRILAFDTATRATAVALCDVDDGELELEARDDPPRGTRPRHAQRLLELVAQLLRQSSTSWEQIDRIAVGVGPGTFTGLRIGVATARALARARDIPLVGVSTLESLALNGLSAGGDRGGAVLAVLDARRGEVFAAGWRGGPAREHSARELLLAPRAMAPDELAALIPDLGPCALAIGDGAVEFRQALERSGTVIPEDESELHSVSAINHCRLAGGLRAGASDEVRPEYLRLPDAEIARRAAASP